MVAYHKKRDDPLRVSSAFKQTLAMRLRIKGYSYLEIAQKMQLLSQDGEPVPGLAHQLVMAGVNSVRLETAEQMRDVELTRYDKLMQIAWHAIERASKRNDTKSIPAIMNSIVRLSDRRAKLMGLDAPVKYDLLMNEARAMAEKLGIPETDLMAEAELVAGAAWGSGK